MGMVARFCEWLVTRYPGRSKTVYRDGKPYLLRFYLTKPRVSGEHIDEEPTQFGIYLHHFYQGDQDPELHSHPWKWALSLILSGGYLEQRHDRASRIHRAGDFNLIKQDTFHRVDLLPTGDPVWTLFTVGPRVATWGFLCSRSGKYWGWQEFLRMKGEDL